MFKYRVVILIAALVHPGIASAFDPFSILAAISAGAQAIGTVAGPSSELSEVKDSADALNDLFGEVTRNGSSGPGEEVPVATTVREIESIAREIGYTSDQIEELLQTDRQQSRKLSGVLRKITDVVKIRNKFADHFKSLDEKAKNAQIESAQTQQALLKAQYRMLAEQRRAQLEGKKEELSKKLQEKRYLESLEKEIKAQGGMKWGKIGAYSFPDVSVEFRKAAEIAKALKEKLLALLLMAFLFRVVYASISMRGPESYGKILSDTFLCAFWLFIAPDLVKLITEQTSALASEVSRVIVGGEDLIGQPMKPVPNGVGAVNIHLWFEWICSNIKILAFQIAGFLFNLGLSLLIVFMPIVIFGHFMFGFSLGLGLIFSMFIGLSLWPLFWNLVGSLGVSLWKHTDLVSSTGISSVCLSLCQFFAPVIGYRLMQGNGIADEVSSSLKKVVNMPQSVAGAFSSPLARATSSGAKNLGTVARYTGSQAVGRTVSAVKRAHAVSAEPNKVQEMMTQGVRGFVSNQPQARALPASGHTPTKTENLRESVSRIRQGLKSSSRLRGDE